MRHDQQRRVNHRRPRALAAVAKHAGITFRRAQQKQDRASLVHLAIDVNPGGAAITPQHHTRLPEVKDGRGMLDTSIIQAVAHHADRR